jgi:hypothetical protein
MNPRKIFRYGVPAAVALFLAASAWAAPAKDLPAGLAGLSGPFDLAAPRTPGMREYVEETHLVHMNTKGRRISTEALILKLRCVPSELRGKPGDEYTCLEFGMVKKDGKTVTIPALAGWSYVFQSGAGEDAQGQVFGIPHAKFEGLVDSDGVPLDVEHGYFVYNSFIDFHGFDDAFARPIPGARGIQELKVPGQSIVHAAANTQPSVNLGKGIKKGSYFRNGEARLAFKGLGLADGRACAVVGFDSGESTLKMIMPMGPNLDIVTEGGSEYIGDLYIDLETRWVRKITLDEFVITETELPKADALGPMSGSRVQGYTIRHILTRLVEKES